MLIYHVSHLEDGDLAKDMLEEQVSNNWPGLAREVDKLVEMLRIEDLKTAQCGKKAYNEVVKTACKWRDEAMMKEEMEPMKEKKMRTMFYQNLGLKDSQQERHGRSGATCSMWPAIILATGNMSLPTGCARHVGE